MLVFPTQVDFSIAPATSYFHVELPTEIGGHYLIYKDSNEFVEIIQDRKRII